jgi:hypothetical protein
MWDLHGFWYALENLLDVSECHNDSRHKKFQRYLFTPSEPEKWEGRTDNIISGKGKIFSSSPLLIDWL